MESCDHSRDFVSDDEDDGQNKENQPIVMNAQLDELENLDDIFEMVFDENAFNLILQELNETVDGSQPMVYELDFNNLVLAPIEDESNNFGDDILSIAINESIGDLNVEIVEKQMPSRSSSLSPLHTPRQSRSKLDDDLKLIGQQCSSKKRKKSAKSLVIANNPKPVNPSAMYKPLLFIRCHSRNDDALDSRTPIWDIKFKPTKENLTDDDIVCTCGGNKINFITVKNGKVLRQYADHNVTEDFNCVVWNSYTIGLQSKLRTRNVTVVVAGGSRKENKKTNIVFVNYNKVDDFVKVGAHSNSVTCLQFHPQSAHLLYSGSWDRKIALWSLNFSNMNKSLSRLADMTVTKLTEIDTNNRLLQLAISPRFNAIVAAGENGLQLLDDVSGVAFGGSKKAKTKKVDVRHIQLPKNDKLVDGLAILPQKTNLIAFRYSDAIIIADLQLMVRAMRKSKESSVRLERITQLRYCEERCAYFYLSVAGKRLVCGDALGRVFIYTINDETLNIWTDVKVEPTEVLEWPRVEDKFVDGGQALDPSRPKFINFAAISQDQKYIVCGLSTNIICIWENNFRIPKKPSSLKKRKL